MSRKIKSIGILGFGNFGRFIVGKLPADMEIGVCDTASIDDLPENASQVSFEKIVAYDALILAIPLSAYSGVFEKLRNLLPADTLLIDICSVKVVPTRMIEKHLPDHKHLLVTHPLFGPRSARGSLKGYQLIITKKQGEKAEAAVRFFKEEGLQLVMATPEEHDKSMALIHALTFFVGRGLADMNLEQIPYETPSYKMLKDLVYLDQSHSDDLFTTIELGNPYAADARKRFMKTFAELEASLEEKKGFYDV